MRLALSQIRLDGNTQPRASLCVDVIQEYSERMQAGVHFPPLTVFFDGQNYWLADGFHRFKAAQRAFPGQPVECDIHQGSLADAQWFSYGANATHGLRRTNADKERAVKAALAHFRAQNLSNRHIADHCGVCDTTVRRYRPIVDPVGAAMATRSVLRHGVMIQMNVSRIGKRQKPRRRRAPRAVPAIRVVAPPPTSISLNLSADNPAAAASTIVTSFDRHFVQLLVAELARRMAEPLDQQCQATA